MVRFIGSLVIVILSFYWRQEVGSVCPFDHQITRPVHTAVIKDVPFVKFQKRVLKRIEGDPQAIPYIIHQTHENDTIPTDMVMSIESILEQNPEYEYRYYNGTERREFIKQYMGSTVLSCYDKLNPKAYKADLFRYSIVYVHGGCYADSGAIFTSHLRTVIERDDTFVSSPDQIYLNAAFFCATKQHRLLAIAIEMIVQRVGSNYYGTGPIDMTGPRLLQRAFQRYYFPREYTIEQGMYPSRIKLLPKSTHSLECLTNFILDFDQRVIFHHRYPRMVEDFSRTVIMVHYTEFFRNRTVYNESVSVEAAGFSIESIPAVKQTSSTLEPVGG